MTSELVIGLSIRQHLAVLSLSNTVCIFGTFGLERARSTVHNLIQVANLQPESGRCPHQTWVDGTVIRPDDWQYWLYVVGNPKTDELLHTRRERRTAGVLAHPSVMELSGKHDVSSAVFLRQWIALVTRLVAASWLRLQIRETWKSESDRTCPQKYKNSNLPLLELLQYRRSRNRRRLDRIVQLRMESAHLDTTFLTDPGRSSANVAFSRVPETGGL